ncbi:MAG: hypothetical protein KBT04_04225, partial [Bacteroidales bacterium]|nr:hypothetical protein [Candidatus Colimorpha onthohippi]
YKGSIYIYHPDTAAVYETAGCDSVVFHGNTFRSSAVDSVVVANAVEGVCDSVYPVNITIRYSNGNLYNEVAVDSFKWRGTTYYQTGDYYEHYTNAAGCDSIDTLRLEVSHPSCLNVYDTVIDTVCKSKFWMGNSYASSGIFTHISSKAVQNRCDSVYTLKLTVYNDSFADVQTVSSCETYTWRDRDYATIGLYYDTLRGAVHGYCDSIFTLNLTLGTALVLYDTVTACDSFYWNRSHQTYYESANDIVFTYIASSIVVCDTDFHLCLKVNKFQPKVFDSVVCDSIRFNNRTYTVNGTYFFPVLDSNNCSGIDTMHLTVRYSSGSEMTINTTFEKYRWVGHTAHYPDSLVSGVYYDTLVNAMNCDSVVTLNLHAGAACRTNTSDTFATCCDSMIWHDTPCKRSDTYRTTLQNRWGCDSIITLHLTVKQTPPLQVTNDTCVVPGNPVQLHAYGADFYEWSPAYGLSSTYSSSPTAAVWQDTRYYVQVIGYASGANLINNGNFEQGNKYFTSGYSYASRSGSSALWAEGKYAIGTNANDYHSNFNATRDHTTGYGKYMIVNGASEPGRTVWSTTVSVTPNTDYAFSTWATTLASSGRNASSQSLVFIPTDNNRIPSWGSYDDCGSIREGVNYLYVYSDLNLHVYDTMKFSSRLRNCSPENTIVGSFTLTQYFPDRDTNSYCYTFYDSINNVAYDISRSTPIPGTDINSISGTFRYYDEVTHEYYDYDDALGALQFSINGQQLGSVFTPSPTMGQWKQFYQVWNSGSNTSATITLLNQSVVASGNDFGIDDIVFAELLCPAIDSVYIHVSHFDTIDTTVCDQFVWMDSTYDVSGVYTQHFRGTHWYDSVVTCNLTVNNTVKTTVYEQACDTFTWHGYTFDHPTSAAVQPEQVFTISGGAANGCDSVVTLSLDLRKHVRMHMDVLTCENLTWRGHVYDSNGVYADTVARVVDEFCDSIYLLGMTFHEGNNMAVRDTVCNSKHWNGNSYTSSGTFLFAYNGLNGCNTVDTLYLVVYNDSIVTTDTAICDGNSITWRSTQYSESTSKQEVETNAVQGRCDIIHQLHLAVNPLNYTSDTAIVCHDYTWAVSGNTYRSSGVYFDTTAAESTTGCDTVRMSHLTVYDTVKTVDNVAECNTFAWRGRLLATSSIGEIESAIILSGTDTTITDTIKNAVAGYCDSIYTLNLNLASATHQVDSQQSCVGYSWNDNYYETSGSYTHGYINEFGCFSVDTLHFTRLENGVNSISELVEATSYQWHGRTLTEAGIYADTNYLGQKAQNGCDSIEILYLSMG